MSGCLLSLFFLLFFKKHMEENSKPSPLQEQQELPEIYLEDDAEYLLAGDDEDEDEEDENENEDDWEDYDSDEEDSEYAEYETDEDEEENGENGENGIPGTATGAISENHSNLDPITKLILEHLGSSQNPGITTTAALSEQGLALQAAL